MLNNTKVELVCSPHSSSDDKNTSSAFYDINTFTNMENFHFLLKGCYEA